MNQILPVTSPELNDLPGIQHAFFARPGGVSKGIYEGLNAGLGSGDDRQSVLENRRRMAHCLGVEPDRMATPYQVHSSDVVVAATAWEENRPKADGIVTSQPGLAIGVVTADCGPVLLADSQAKVIGACHAGWKGALNGVLENTVEEMVRLGARRQAITAVLGPTISQKNYQVGPGFPEPFLETSSKNESYFATSDKEDHYQFDLTGYIVDRLSNAGVNASAVRRCTYGEETNFYSYRRTTHRNEADYGRQLSAIILRDE